MAKRKQSTSRTAKSPGTVACDAGKPTGARRKRLERIRKEIENDTYETEGKLRIAISRLIDDVLAGTSKERC